MTGDAVLQYDIFHIIFIVALISVSLQGTLLPTMAKSWIWWTTARRF